MKGVKKFLLKTTKLQLSLILILLMLSAEGCSHQSTQEDLCEQRPFIATENDIDRLSDYAIDNYYRELMMWTKHCDPQEYKRLMAIK